MKDLSHNVEVRHDVVMLVAEDHRLVYDFGLDLRGTQYPWRVQR